MKLIPIRTISTHFICSCLWINPNRCCCNRCNFSSYKMSCLLSSLRVSSSLLCSFSPSGYFFDEYLGVRSSNWVISVYIYVTCSVSPLTAPHQRTMFDLLTLPSFRPENCKAISSGEISRHSPARAKKDSPGRKSCGKKNPLLPFSKALKGRHKNTDY